MVVEAFLSNSIDQDLAVLIGSPLFVSILKMVYDVRQYIKQATLGDGIFKCIFVGALSFYFFKKPNHVLQSALCQTLYYCRFSL